MTDLWAPILPKSDEELVEELNTMMLAYLQSDGPAHRATPARLRSDMFEGIPLGPVVPPKR